MFIDRLLFPVCFIDGSYAACWMDRISNRPDAHLHSAESFKSTASRRQPIFCIAYLIVAHRVCPDKPPQASRSCIVIALIDASDMQVIEYRYDACDTAAAKTGSMTVMPGMMNPFRYRGYMYDEETVLDCYTSLLKLLSDIRFTKMERCSCAIESKRESKFCSAIISLKHSFCPVA